MKTHELLGYAYPSVPKNDTAGLNGLAPDFEIWTTNEEAKILKKLDTPVRLSTLSETEQFRIASMIRKSLVTKIGQKDPKVVANEKTI